MDGEEIRSLRDELGVSQQEFARRLQVAQSSVDRWESGLSTPTGEVLARLQRLRRFKEFQTEGRMISLEELVRGETVEEEEGNDLPPWHPDSEGVAPGHLSLVVSPPKCGKTLTALRWAYQTCRRHGTATYYVSTHWTPSQTLAHLEKGLPEGEEIDPHLPFFIFQHDGKDLSGLLEELSQKMTESEGALVVFDWLQNLDYLGERFLHIDEKERQILRDLKTWSTQQRAYVLLIASQRGIGTCDTANFPHFFELADSISIGAMEQLKRRRVEYRYQDLHKGGVEVFTFELPATRDLHSPRSDEPVGPTPRRTSLGVTRN